MTRPRWHSPGLYLFIIAALTMAVVIVLVGLSGDGSAQTDPPSSGDWVVADDTVVRDAYVLLEGNLTVKPTGGLILINVTLEMNVTRPGRHRIIVDTGGSMTVKDNDGDPSTTYDQSVVRSFDPQREYQWLCESGSTLRISASTVMDCGAGWGLLVESDDVLIEESTISSGYIGVHIRHGSAVITNTTISGHDLHGVVVVNGTVSMDGCRVTNNYDIGVLVAGGAGTSSIRNCTISNHTFSAIDVQSGRAVVEDCTLVNTSWSGVRFNNDTTGAVHRCEISDTDVYGVMVNANCTVTVAGSTIYDIGDSGIMVYNATCTMKGNHLRECGNDGIYAFDSAIDVRENLVELSDQKGILISDCRLFMVYDNVVRANGISGIVVGSQGLKDSVGWLGDNDITGNGRNGLYVASNSTCVMYGSNFEGNGWYGVYCQKGGTLEWTVSGTSRVINETLRVRGTVEVARGGTLVVVNSTLHFDHHPEYSWGSVLVSGGEMRVTEGSEVTKGTDLLLEDRDVRLTVRDGGSLNGSGSYFMSSLVIVNEGRFEAYACEFSTENRSISIDGQETYLRLDGCTFTDGASGVVANGADVLIVRCDFLRMSEGIRLVDCNGPGPTVRDTSMFSVRAGLVLEGSYGVNVDNCTFTICQDAILATDVNLLRITNSTISKGTGHGIRSIDSSVHVTDCVLSECAAGAIVHDTNLLWVEGTTIANNQRVGIWANMTELVLVNTSVTNTFGIGVRNSYNPAGQGQDDFFARDSFFQGSAAYDLRLEGAFLARVYNSKLEPDAVRIMDDVVLEVYNPWILRVVVEGEDPVPPAGTWYKLIDQYGKVQGVGGLPDGTNVLGAEGKAYTMTATNSTVHTPYTVTVDVAGRDWTGDVVLGFGIVSTIYVDLEIVPDVRTDPEPTEGSKTTLDGSSSVSYPFNVSGWEWTIEGLEGGPWTSPTIEVTFPGDGDYRVQLRITDEADNSNSTVVRLTILDAAPEALIVSNVPDELNEDQVLELEGRYVTVVDDIIIQEWDFGDGTKASGPSVDHTWERAGNYNITFTVVEADGGFAQATREVRVLNVAPEAIIKDVSLEVGKRERFDLDGSLSTDTPSDSGTLSYMWDMGGEPFLTGAQAFWRFEEVGEYTINLMVVDDDGAWDRASMTVTVVNRLPTIGPIPDAILNATDPVWSHKLVVYDPDDDLENLTIIYPQFEPGGAFASWVERDDDGGWTVYVRPKEERDGSRADVQVTVRDPDGGEASSTFLIDIDTSMVDEGSAMWWVVIAALLMLVVLTVGFYVLTRRQVPPPQEEET